MRNKSQRNQQKKKETIWRKEECDHKKAEVWWRGVVGGHVQAPQVLNQTGEDDERRLITLWLAVSSSGCCCCSDTS